jgi:hypothetical protein
LRPQLSWARNSSDRQIKSGLVRLNFKEDGNFGEHWQEAPIPPGGRIRSVGGMVVKDDAAAGESVASDGLQGEQGVVQSPQAVPDNEEHR